MGEAEKEGIRFFGGILEDGSLGYLKLMKLRQPIDFMHESA